MAISLLLLSACSNNNSVNNKHSLLPYYSVAIDGLKNGLVKTRNDSGEIVAYEDYTNDTLDGICLYFDNDYGTEYYYDMGNYNHYSEYSLSEDRKFAIKRFFKVDWNKKEAKAMGVLVNNRKKEIVDSLSSYYNITTKSDTVLQNQNIDINVSIYKESFMDNVEAKLYIDNFKIVDTITNSKILKFKVTPRYIGKNKIRGRIIYYGILEGDSVSKELPFYKDFYVKEK